MKMIIDNRCLTKSFGLNSPRYHSLWNFILNFIRLWLESLCEYPNCGE